MRLDRFWTQAELARRAGITNVTVSRLELGQFPPSARTVRALAQALEVEPRDLARPDEVAEAQKTERAAA